MTDPSFAIVVRELKKTLRVGFFSRRIELLRDVSFEVTSGSVFGFVGPNGAGKSTTIKTLIGAARATAGSVEVLGGSPRDPRVRRRIGYLPELPNLPATLTPRELLWLHAKLCGYDRAGAKRRIDELLERVELTHRGSSKVGSFSKGMLQRVGLAIALVGEPELLILDEPMSGLDPLGRRLVRDIIREQKARGRTVFFSSHILPDVEALCDELALLARGRVLKRGALIDVIDARAVGWEVLFEATRDDISERAKTLGKLERRGHTWLLHVDAGTDPLQAAAELRQLGGEIIGIESLRASLEDNLTSLIEKDAEAQA